MYELIDQGKTDPKFQELVYGITKGIANKNYRGEVNALFHWTKKNIRYTRDPYGVELVQDVWATLSRGRADCDDFTILLGSECEVMGAPIRIVTVSTRPDKEPVHVYPEACVAGSWLPLDVTVANSYPGWAPTRITDRIVWTRKDVGISGYDETNIEGLGMDFFKQTVDPVNLTPGIPDDIAHTYADLLPGDQVSPARPQPGLPVAKVADVSDLSESPYTGGPAYRYGPMRIQAFPMPKDIWSRVPRASVPIKVNAWPNEAKPWKEDWGAMNPQPDVPMDEFMKNLGGYMGGLNLGGLGGGEADAVVAAIAADTKRKVATGAIAPHQAAAHAAHVVDAIATGDLKTVSKNPHTAKAVMAIARSKPRKESGMWGDLSINWIPRPDGSTLGGLGEYAHLTLGELDNREMGELCDAINSDVAQQVRQGSVPPAAAEAVASKIVDAVSAGNASVMAAAPATAAAVKRIAAKKGARTVSTPATKSHHPITSHTARKHGIRAHSQDYDGADESTEFLPAMYGMGGSGSRAVLYGKVHRLVKQRLPIEARKAGVKAEHLHKLFGRTGASMNGLGDDAPIAPSTTASAAGVITNTIMGVVDPADAAAVSQAVDAGVKAIVGGAVAQASPGFSFNLSGWGVPLLVTASVIGLAMFMAKPKRKISYKRNPSRRRSRRSIGRRGGGKGLGKYVPWLLAGGAAYMIFKPKAVVPGAPAQAGLLSSLLNIFKPATGTSPGATAPSSIGTGIANLFTSIFGGSKAAPASPAAPATSSSTSTSPAYVFEKDIEQPAAAPADSPSMVISLDEG